MTFTVKGAVEENATDLFEQGYVRHRTCWTRPLPGWRRMAAAVNARSRATPDPADAREAVGLAVAGR